MKMAVPDSKIDAIVIGTGFAGAVTACRLAQAGFHICVLERGRRYGPDDFPIYPPQRPSVVSGEGASEEEDYVQPDLSRCIWKLGQGLWDIRDLGEVVVAQAAGFGGGSLIYANVHLRAPAEVFDERWPKDYRRDNLDPYYDLAAYMLDVKPIPKDILPPKTGQMQRAAHELKRSGQCFLPPLAITFKKEELKEESENTIGGEQNKSKVKLVNKFGHEQGVCDMRGDCCFGCPKQAKNTLDLNYLELAEKAQDGEDHPLADIRTLAEVVSIKEVQDDESGETCYEVEYYDHLFGKPRDPNERVNARETKAVRARYVFLCAGAINSTELLLRSYEAGTLPFTGKGLGEGYYPNADTIATVFDCDQLQEMDHGPTITAAILYNGQSDKKSHRDWFLIEDGGMPTALEPLLGVFRSPLWARRNRYRELPASEFLTSQPPSYAQLPFETVMDVLSGLTRHALRPRLPLAHDVTEHFLSTMQASREFEWPEGCDPLIKRWHLLPQQIRDSIEENRREFLEAVSAVAGPMVGEFLEGAAKRIEGQYDLERDILKSFPLQGVDIGGIGDLHLTRDFLRLSVQLIWGSEGDLVRHIVDLLLGQIVKDPKGLVTRASDLLRWALDYRVGDGHTALLLSMGRDSYPGKLFLVMPSGPPVGSTIVGEQSRASGTLVSPPTLISGSWAKNDAAGILVLSNVKGNFKPGEILKIRTRTIGIYVPDQEWVLSADPLPREMADTNKAIWSAIQSLQLSPIRFNPITLYGNDREFPASRRRTPVRKVSTGQDLTELTLRAELPGPFVTSERIVQDQLFRDIAANAWGGELRTNPAWNFLDRRLTVHSQGGCAMAPTEQDGVTRANGEVFGCDGLYVMDAAAFPTPVGVNPSATIAAIAEYKIETFIKDVRGRPWEAGEFAKAADWATNLDFLDPIGSREKPSSKTPVHKPIGIKFEEVMKGFHYAVPPETHELSRDRDKSDCPKFRSDELTRLGNLDQDQSNTIITSLVAEIEDLAEFLESYRMAEPPKIPIKGNVEIRGVPEFEGKKCNLLPKESFMRLMVESANAEEGQEQRTIHYNLHFVALPKQSDEAQEGHSTHKEVYVIRGCKFIRDDPRFDVWEDATTLYFELKKGDDNKVRRRGILRLPAAEFFGNQLPNIKATNTNDPARQGWALTAFGKFFFSHLVDVYVPELDEVVDVVRRIVGRTHV